MAGWRRAIKNALRPLGWDDRNWLRVRQIEEFDKFLGDQPEGFTMLEVSPARDSLWRKYSKTYQEVHYPDFNVCTDRLEARFDIVLADQVLEHVDDPISALENMRSMLNPGGHVVIATPFLFRVHNRPDDLYRWTESGLRAALIKAGFSSERIATGSWGNKACARAHIGGTVRDAGWFPDLSNDPEYPIMVWAFAGL